MKKTANLKKGKIVSSVCTAKVKSYPLIAATRSRCVTSNLYGLLSSLPLYYEIIHLVRTQNFPKN